MDGMLPIPLMLSEEDAKRLADLGMNIVGCDCEVITHLYLVLHRDVDLVYRVVKSAAAEMKEKGLRIEDAEGKKQFVELIASHAASAQMHITALRRNLR